MQPNNLFHYTMWYNDEFWTYVKNSVGKDSPKIITRVNNKVITNQKVRDSLHLMSTIASSHILLGSAFCIFFYFYFSYRVH
jgi:hypothetical protein